LRNCLAPTFSLEEEVLLCGAPPSFFFPSLEGGGPPSLTPRQLFGGDLILEEAAASSLFEGKASFFPPGGVFNPVGFWEHGAFFGALFGGGPIFPGPPGGSRALLRIPRVKPVGFAPREARIPSGQISLPGLAPRTPWKPPL